VGEACRAGVDWSLVVSCRSCGEPFVEQVELGGSQPFECLDMRLLKHVVRCRAQQLLVSFDGDGVSLRDAGGFSFRFEFDLPTEDAIE
jgi:hypothetical protein